MRGWWCDRELGLGELRRSKIMVIWVFGGAMANGLIDDGSIIWTDDGLIDDDGGLMTMMD